MKIVIIKTLKPFQRSNIFVKFFAYGNASVFLPFRLGESNPVLCNLRFCQVTGYQLLDTIGRAFAIPDCIWYQLPDCDLYIGGAEHSLFVNRPVEIPPEFSQGAAGGNSMIMPMVQSMRPDVEMNGQRVTKMALNNDEMTVTWTPRNRATGKALQKTPVQRQIEQH